MTHRSRTQRLALLSASTALVTAGLLPSTTAFAAPPHRAAAAAAPTPTPSATESPAQSVKTTDPPSGITADLPGKAKVRTGSLPLDDKPVEARVYMAEVPEGGSGFAVYDMPGDRYTQEDQLKGFVEAFSLVGLGTMTSQDVHKTTVDGRPVLDARLSGKDGDESTVGFIRLISDDDHAVMALTLGAEANKKDLTETHQQLVDSLEIP
ncbi:MULTISPECIES: hypothetical protein [unclassified Streptomyces]|uniref:hypothetical protein n=1 Tax=unclassified Streptomyces TaxID=2593676 RepID=UPI0004BDC094|nr:MULTISPECIES: hypothetical protein [unclassified Streptomyces]